MDNLIEDSDGRTSDNERIEENSSQQIIIDRSALDNPNRSEETMNLSPGESHDETTHVSAILTETVSQIHVEMPTNSTNTTNESTTVIMSEQTIITSTDGDALPNRNLTTELAIMETSQFVQRSTNSSTTPFPTSKKKPKFIIDFSPIRDPPLGPVEQCLGRIHRDQTAFLYNGQNVEINVQKLKESREFISSGQYGSVDLVTLGEPANLTMAVKRIRMDNKPSDHQAIYAEITALEKLRNQPSPYIVDFYCALIDTARGELCICMAYMTTTVEMFYRTMHQLDRVNNDDVNTFVKRCAHDLILALDHLQRLGIVHRDVKPKNLLMNAHGQVKLCDFGISGRLDPREPDFEINVGTELYLRPESKKCSITNDMWSTAMSLVEISNGEHPLAERPMMNESPGDIPDRIIPSAAPVPFRMAEWADRPKIPEKVSSDVQNLISTLFTIEDGSKGQSYQQIIEKSFISQMTPEPSGDELILNEYVLERILPFGIPESGSQPSSD